MAIAFVDPRVEMAVAATVDARVQDSPVGISPVVCVKLTVAMQAGRVVPFKLSRQPTLSIWRERSASGASQATNLCESRRRAIVWTATGVNMTVSGFRHSARGCTVSLVLLLSGACKAKE